MIKLTPILANFASLNCPKCNESKIYVGPFKIKSECDKCHYKFMPSSEGWAGAALINYSISVIFVILTLVISLLIFKWEYLEWQAVFALFVGVTINILFYRYAHSLWINFLFFNKYNENS